MTNDLLNPPGGAVEPEELTVSKAHELFRYLAAESHPYASLVGVRRAENGDVVVYDVQPEVPQYPTNPIERTEHLATLFFDDDDRVPRTLALRADFPLVPHLQLEDDEFPRSLCLFEQPYDEVRRSWTAPRHIRRVREWLSRTARGELHTEDQALEPLMLDPPIPIVLPREVWVAEDDDESPLSIAPVDFDEDDPLPGAFLAGTPVEGEPRFLALRVTTEPQPHGVIRHLPNNLAELARLLQDVECDLRSFLENRLNTYWGEQGIYRDARLVLVLRLPKQREPQGEIEDWEAQAFLFIDHTIEELGEEMGLWERTPGGEAVGRIIDREDSDFTGEEVPLFPLNPVQEVTKSRAQDLSGIEVEKELAAVAIGVGALGSQIVANLNRMGWGRWTLVDQDNLMPHNLVRHALPFWMVAGQVPYVGAPKAHGIADLLDRQFFRPSGITTIKTDVLQSPKPDQLHRAMQDADVAIDMSASESVGRELGTESNIQARRMSVFLNPCGTDLIFLCEDEEKDFPLDVLEPQYHRGHLRQDRLGDHLALPDGRVRYGQSCRDMTTPIPQDLVALHAGLGARAVRKAVEEPHPTIIIYSASTDGSVTPYTIEPAEWHEDEHDSWTVRWDDELVSKMMELRAGGLPAETGGILLGIHDFDQRILYVLDALPAPPDSVENAWPPGFIRGSRGVRRSVEKAKHRTGSTVTYAGEWHSHPDGASGTPSTDDDRVLEWLTDYLQREGLPAVMAIAWDGGISWYLRCTIAVN